MTKEEIDPIILRGEKAKRKILEDNYYMNESIKIREFINKYLITDNNFLLWKRDAFHFENYLREFELEYDIFWKSVGSSDFLKHSEARSILEGKIKQDIALRLVLEFIFLKTREEEIIYYDNMRSRIANAMTTYSGIVKICKINKEETELNLNIDLLKSENNRKKFEGRQLSEFKVKAYSLILSKNEEYRKETGKDNYKGSLLKIIRHLDISRDDKEEIERLYKSFNAFQTKYDINTLEDLKNILSI